MLSVVCTTGCLVRVCVCVWLWRHADDGAPGATAWGPPGQADSTGRDHHLCADRTGSIRSQPACLLNKPNLKRCVSALFPHSQVHAVTRTHALPPTCTCFCFSLERERCGSCVISTCTLHICCGKSWNSYFFVWVVKNVCTHDCVWLVFVGIQVNEISSSKRLHTFSACGVDGSLQSEYDITWPRCPHSMTTYH